MITDAFEIELENESLDDLETLQNKVDNGIYDDILVSHPLIIFTTEGLVQVLPNKNIIKNIAISVSDSLLINGIHLDEDGTIKVNKVSNAELADMAISVEKVNNKLIFKLSNNESENIEFDGSDIKIIDLSGFLNKSGGDIAGNLTVLGNLIVNGNTTTVESTNLVVSDKLIKIAKDNVTKLLSPAGLIVPNYDGNNNTGALVFDGDGTAYVGDVVLTNDNIDVTNSGTTMQPIATRSNENDLNDNHLIKWDAENKKLVDAGKDINDIVNRNEVCTIDESEEYLKYYDSRSIIPTPEEYFTYESLPNNECKIIGLTNLGQEADLTYVVIPYKINNLIVTELSGRKASMYNSDESLFGTKASEIKHVILPNTITHIGVCTFYTCTNLLEVNIPDSVINLEGDSFVACNELTTLELSKNLQILNFTAFVACNKLKELYIPDSVEIINGSIIGTGLKKISLPNHEIINAFASNTVNNAYIEIRSGNSYNNHEIPCFSESDYITLKLPDTCTSISALIFNSCNYPTIIIPSSVQNISTVPIFNDCENPLVICEPGSYADNWAKQQNINVKYDYITREVLDNIYDKLSTVYNFKGSIDPRTLMTHGHNVGDVYNIMIDRQFNHSGFHIPGEHGFWQDVEIINGAQYDFTYIYPNDPESVVIQIPNNININKLPKRLRFRFLEQNIYYDLDFSSNPEDLLHVNMKNRTITIERTPFAFAGCTLSDISNTGTCSIEYIPIKVYDGDNVVWTDDGWDKLASTVDLSNYSEKHTSLAGYGIQDAYTKSQIDAKISSVYKVKGTIDNTSFSDDERALNPSVGDVWNINIPDNSYSHITTYVNCDFRIDFEEITDFLIRCSIDITGDSIEPILISCGEIDVIYCKTDDDFIPVTSLNVASHMITHAGSRSYVILLINGSFSNYENFKHLVGISINYFKEPANELHTGDNIVWTGETWDKLAGNIDLSNYAEKGTTLADYGITDVYTKSQIDSKISSVYKIKGSINPVTFNESNRTIGDVYNIMIPAGYNITSYPIGNTSNDNSYTIASSLHYEKIYSDDIFLGIKVTMSSAEFNSLPKRFRVRFSESSYGDVDASNSILNFSEVNSDFIVGLYSGHFNTAGFNLSSVSDNAFCDIEYIPVTVQDGDNIVWTADGWDKLSAIVDLSSYYTKNEVNASINSIVNSITNLLTEV